MDLKEPGNLFYLVGITRNARWEDLTSDLCGNSPSLVARFPNSIPK